MSVNLGVPETKTKLKPRILVLGVGGGGCNALNSMIKFGLKGVEFVACNTDAQSLEFCEAKQKIQLGIQSTRGLGAGSDPSTGKSAAEESYNEICEYIDGAHMAFIAAGMGGGTGTGAVSTIAKACKEKGILTVAVVTKPFPFEGKLRMDNAEKGIEELRNIVDTIIIIPNQNLYIVCDEKTSASDAFCMCDQVLHAGVKSVTDLIMQPGLINLDFADVRAVMSEMGRAVFGHGEAAGERRAVEAAESAISNPLLDRVSLEGTKGLLLNVSGGPDMSLVEITEAADRIKQEIDDNARIIFGSSIDKELDGMMRVSIIATGIGNVVELPNSNNKSEVMKENDLIKDVVNENKPKLAEQTDLEDFTNPIVEIKKNVENNVTSEVNLNRTETDATKQENQQVKPRNVVMEFIKKVSSFKIFNKGKREENNKDDIESPSDFLEKENLEVKDKEENNKIIEEPTMTNEFGVNKEEIVNNDDKSDNLNKNEEKEVEIANKSVEPVVEKNDEKTLVKDKDLNLDSKKHEEKKVQIQSEMPGLDENPTKEDAPKKKEDEKEDLEIPSFLRNQSN